MKEFYDISLYIALVFLAMTAFLVLYRLVIGPSIADRVTAFDVLTCVVIGMLGIFAIRTNNYRYIDVVLTMSFVVFLGAIAFSFYLRKQGKP
jgi:multicomponent Na+:H+ antiporter subunit F